ncbi:D-alanyl-D-alanine carboxypeptidase (penicillin-binding protein 5/6) [Nocardia amikacinitolerans]|uniref:D-alanyl-D-alanine carboxypeptidase (Penicillin-binding protein 5/6) n=2 Tax=Nocardia amikacinitolerans TaxID=756689 RepID=A0A285LUE3_9NOCA|nr:D-alanyl-D-alanine carboxypeptidase (penicillin-binding protein 5/6) [Nocardia amikacinitolerans]
MTDSVRLRPLGSLPMRIPHPRHRAARCLAGALAAATLLGGAFAAPAFAAPTTTTTAPFTTPNTDNCPQKTKPPAPIDASEVPAPGQPTPGPLAVPVPPVGGTRMGECGVVLPKGAPPPPKDISATAWMVSDLDTGEVLAAKDPHGRYRPASTIKVLLATVALRTLQLDTVVTGTQADADVDGTRVGIGPGGRYTNRQLMQALIMASGNDAAHAIAAQLGGDDAAVAKMNELAKSLYAFDTRAATPSGLDGPGMSTSAYDLSLLFREAMTIPLFAEFIRTEQIDFPGYPKNQKIPDDTDHPGFAVGNDNQLLFNYEGALGGKTGFTDDARQTFVAAAQRDGRRLAVTLLQAEVRPLRPWEQAARLLDYGFALPAGTQVGMLPNHNSTDAKSTAALAAPPGPEGGDVLASPPHERDNAGVRTLLMVGGIVLILFLLLKARRVNRQRR